MTIKMIVSDLDGTLVNSNEKGYKISSELIKEIDEFKKRGKIFTIATGRPKETTIDVVKTLGINGPYIIYNGAKIIDINENEIYSNEFNLEILWPFIKKVMKENAAIIFAYDKKVFCLEYNDKVKSYENKELIKCYVADKNVINSKILVNKVLVIGNVQRYKEYWNNLDESLKSEFKYLISEDNYFEIVRKNVSKGNALKELKKYLNIKDDEVLAIGNHMNDKELIEEAHIGVAVENAVEELKDAADFVMKNEYEKGVIEAIKKFE